MSAVIAASGALLGRKISGPVAVHVTDGHIAEVRDTAEPAEGVLTAGLVDIQINGAVGVDFAEVDADAMRTVVRALPSTGVTSFLPTLITAKVPTITRQAHELLAAIAQIPAGIGARTLGLHFEGPFISPDRHGVHEPALMEHPTAAHLDTILRDPVIAAALRKVTLAPELPGGMEAVRRLTDAGVLVAVGHSDATAAQTHAAADAGARMITHLFNAQRPLGHREPGVPGAALVDDRYTLGLIADLAHVSGEICKLVFNAAGPRVALVTDAVAAAGMPPGSYLLGGAEVLLTEEGVPRSPEGTIAGSALTLDRAVRNIIGLGIDPAVALTAASEVPANVLGEKKIGRIETGAHADLVLWDAEWHPRKVWVGGNLVFDADESIPVPAMSREVSVPAAGN
ncbi:N-acetylglucosamine-6-phosphate deacetylase [Pseudonocardiaceae bacterium YIM PH 21723]|nr:N-acetylglucosamine-6-phosphate deacetylase [Pseudonocardiaceae bacterium YIM PH 21723]